MKRSALKPGILAAAVALCLLLTACGSTSNTPSDSSPDQSTSIISSDLDTSLTDLQQYLQESGQPCAVAYLGLLEENSESALQTLLESNGYAAQYPFLTQIPQERICPLDGLEAYCIVPRDDRITLTVSECIVDESNDFEGAPGKEVYTCQDAAPFIVIGNESDIVPNIWVEASESGIEPLGFPLFTSPENGSLVLPDGDPGILDFTRSLSSSSAMTEQDLIGTWTALNMVDCDGNNRICGLDFFENGTMEYWLVNDDGLVQGRFCGTYTLNEDTGLTQFELTATEGTLAQDGADPSQSSGSFSLTQEGDGEMMLEHKDGQPLFYGVEGQFIYFVRSIG